MSDKKLVVMLHGVGSDGDDLASLIPFFKNEFENFEFFSPDGIEDCDIAPFGYQWFSLSNRDPHVIKSELERSWKIVDKIISEKQKELGISRSNTILLGFSQGTMMSLYLSLVSDEKFCAVIGFSGALILPDNIKNKDFPVCLVHGRADEVVHPNNLLYAKSTLEKNNFKNVNSLLIDELSHSIDIEGLNFAIKFMKNI